MLFEQNLQYYRQKYGMKRAEVEEKASPWDAELSAINELEQGSEEDLWAKELGTDMTTSATPMTEQDLSSYTQSLESNPILAQHRDQIESVLEELLNQTRGQRLTLDQANQQFIKLMEDNVRDSFMKETK